MAERITLEDIELLPRLAQVAFAARCARRVEPLFKAFWTDASLHHVDAVADAIDAAEMVAESGKPKVEPRAAAVVAERAATLAERANADVAAHAAYAAAAAADVATTGSLSAENAEWAYTNAARAVYLINQSPDDNRSLNVSSIAERRVLDAMLDDYQQLSFSARAIRFPNLWDKTPFDTKTLGPLWPRGLPTGWPGKDEPRLRSPAPTPMLHVEFAVPAGAERSAVNEQIAKVLVAMSDLYRAQCGTGLRIVDGDAFNGVAVSTVESPSGRGSAGNRRTAGLPNRVDREKVGAGK